jgi:outer membrane protein OmpA-like peptidoglycan-associated protein
MDLNFRFLSNGTSLDNKALADIRRTLAAFKENNIRSAEVLGFADSKGDPRRNQELSEQRAAVVAAELSKYGIDARVAGFSYAMPVGDNATQEGRDKNRRVEVWAK